MFKYHLSVGHSRLIFVMNKWPTVYCYISECKCQTGNSNIDIFYQTFISIFKYQGIVVVQIDINYFAIWITHRGFCFNHTKRYLNKQSNFSSVFFYFFVNLWSRHATTTLKTRHADICFKRDVKISVRAGAKVVNLILVVALFHVKNDTTTVSIVKRNDSCFCGLCIFIKNN